MMGEDLTAPGRRGSDGSTTIINTLFPYPPLNTNDTNRTSNNTQELSKMVTEAAKSAKKTNNVSSSLARLRLANMKLHGRDDDIQLLKNKLLELKKKSKKVDTNIEESDGIRFRNTGSSLLSTSSSSRGEQQQQQQQQETHQSQDNGQDGQSPPTKTLESYSMPELVLVSGVSGTGKSALVLKGLKEPAERMAMTFVSGKFDLNNTALPLSAFMDAMTSLTKIINEGDKRQKIQKDINESISEDDTTLIVRALPGCEKLFSMHKRYAVQKQASQFGSVVMGKESRRQSTSLVGKEAIIRLQYAIRGLLKIISIHLGGLVLFIDDLQVTIVW